jgi:hypothetical protein
VHYRDRADATIRIAKIPDEAVALAHGRAAMPGNGPDARNATAQTSLHHTAGDPPTA